jgi:selenide, water dikinase
VKRILLIGAGHAHLVVLRALAKQPLYGARVTLVSPYARQIYSGMLPGLLAGHYRIEDATIDIAQLAARASVEFAQDEVSALDLVKRKVRLYGGVELDYDMLSLNAGSAIDTSIPGSPHALTVKPFEDFLERLSRAKPARVAIAGAGAGGMELAMALRFHGAAVTLYSDRPAMSDELARRAHAALRGVGVDFRPGMPVTGIEPGPVVIAGTSHQAFDTVLLATGAVPLSWLHAIGLAADARGFALVDRTLRSLSHREVFASGDCASLGSGPDPKSGVYSVRQGETLQENLRRAISGEEPLVYRSRRRALQILSCGGKYAIAERGGFSAQGGWVWRWKDWIDRRWVRSFA